MLENPRRLIYSIGKAYALAVRNGPDPHSRIQIERKELGPPPGIH